MLTPTLTYTHPQRTAGKQATQPSGLRWHGAPVSGSQANASWSPEVTPAFSSDAANAHSMMASRDTRQGWARERPSLASGTPALLLRMKEPHSPARVGHLPEKAWPGWDPSYCGPAPCACCPPGPPPTPFPGRGSRLDEAVTVACNGTTKRVQRG